MTEADTLKRSTLEMILDHTRVVIFILLGLISIVALITQSDKEMIRYVLGGCATLAVVTAIFIND